LRTRLKMEDSAITFCKPLFKCDVKCRIKYNVLNLRTLWVDHYQHTSQEVKWSLRDFRVPVRCKWVLRSFGTLGT